MQKSAGALGAAPSPVPLRALVAALRGAHSKDTALTAALLAVRMTCAGHAMNSRDVRRFIAENAEALAAELRPGVLVAEAPWGFWLAADVAELEARARHLAALEKAAAQKLATFVRACAQAGFRFIVAAA